MLKVGLRKFYRISLAMFCLDLYICEVIGIKPIKGDSKRSVNLLLRRREVNLPPPNNFCCSGLKSMKIGRGVLLNMNSSF